MRRCFPVLSEAVRHVAHPAIRNRGTLGGSLAHADPAAELPMMALLLDARIAVSGPRWRASGCPRAHSSDPRSSPPLRDDEMVIRVEFPLLPPGVGWGFEEVARRAGDFALAAVAAALRLDADGKVEEARIAVMACTIHPFGSIGRRRGLPERR